MTRTVAAGLAAVALLAGAAAPTAGQEPPSVGSAAAAEDTARHGAALDGRRVSDPAAFGWLHDLLDAAGPGVDVRRSSGSLGAAPSLRLRAPTTLDPGAEPLVYVDGARVVDDNQAAFGFFVGGQEPSRLADLPMEDVAAVTVLEGPAAAALHGTGASAGVVLIRTRRGGRGEPARWRLWTEQGASRDPTDWWSLAWNPIRSSVHVPGAKDTTYVQSLLEGTRYGRPFRTGRLQAYGASVRGGTEALSYYLSAGASDEEGSLPANGRERLRARANAGLRLSPELELSVSTGYVDARVRLPENDDNLFGMVGNALGSPWWGPTTARDPNRGGAPIPTCFLMLEFARATGDPLAERSRFCAPTNPFFLTSFEEIATISNHDDVGRFTGSAALRWRSSPALVHRVTAGWDRSDAVQTEVVPVDPARPFGADSEGRIDRAEIDESRVTLEASSTLEAAPTEELATRTTLGLRWHAASRDLDFAVGRRFPAGDPSLGASEEVGQRRAAAASARTLGLVLQQGLSWRGRLFLDAGARLDHHNGVEEGGPRLYPTLRAAWRADAEPWWPEALGHGRLHAAWGRSGRGPDLDDAFDVLAPVPGMPGAAPEELVPPFGARGLRPEIVTEWEVGLELAGPDHRVALELTAYGRRATDVLVPVDPSARGPGEDVRLENAAEISSGGVEAALDVRPLDRGGVRWDLRLTLATSEDEITELPAPIPFRESAQSHREGFPVGGYFDRPVTVTGAGEAVTGAETFLGTPTPAWEGSVATSLRVLDRIRLSARADYAGGHVLHDLTEDFACRLMGGGRDEEGRLRGACPAIFELDATGRPTREALRKIEASRTGTAAPYVYPADHLRLRSASVRFRLPERWLDALGGVARSAALSVAGENLATWTRYPGTDPEVSESGPNPILRQQFLGVPADRRFTARIEVGL